jgi:succinoglycan biosynthesis protein ExoM
MLEKHHISVCVCTYKRPRLLGTLLRTLEGQETGGLFDYEVVVVDNDRSGSARQIVESQIGQSKLPIHYFVEPVQNIARARNKAVANSKGDFVAFLDDDELPESRWLLHLYKALTLFEASGVLGPVIPRYDVPPPRWVLKGRFFERPAYFSGYFLNWWVTRTGNCLLKRSIFDGDGCWFLPKFGSGGEDRDFFKRMIPQGHVFVWCDEAPLHEAVPPERWKKDVMLKRALLRGKMTYNSRRHKPEDVVGSAAAVLFYSVGLPFLLILSPVFGFDVFMKTLIRDCDHLGKVLALFKINIVKDRYVT